MKNYVAVTGAGGFIGRAVTRRLLERGSFVYAVDALTYAADPACLEQFRRDYPSQFCLVVNDVRNLGRLPDVDSVIHLAAETHVDNSLKEPQRFVDVNVGGTAHILNLIRDKAQHGMPHLVHISTDECYGSIEEGKATPESPLRPSSPYAASKAAADLLVQAWGHTFGVPYSIVRPTNVYGKSQHPEKLIPKCVRSLMLGRPIPIHGDGTQTRLWLWLEDVASAILFVLDNPHAVPPIVNVGGNAEVSVGHVAQLVRAAMGGEGSIEVGFERPGQDTRYSVCDAPLRAAGWQPQGDFFADLPEIVAQEAKSFRF